MGAPLSIRRRLLSAQSLRQSQPVPWSDGLGARFLAAANTASVTASATTNTVGAWSQVLSNTAATEVAGLLVLMATATAASNTDTGMLIDIGVGGTTTPDYVAIQSLAVSQHSGFSIAIPIQVPASSRVWARIQSAVASRTATIGCSLFSTAFADRLPAVIDVLGTSTATSVGTAMSGSSGTAVEIIASTTKDYQAVVMVPSYSDVTSGANTTVRFDLMSGSTLATALASIGFVVQTTSLLSNTNNQPQLAHGLYGAFVPAGTRLGVRHNIAATPGRYDACLIGVPYA